MLVRAAEDHDLAAIAKVAFANDEHAATDPGYVAHLREHGEFLVAERDGDVVGYAATRPIGGATMLCDLFIDPVHQGAGVGRRLLATAFEGREEIFTFSSRNPRALPLYVSCGLVPRWPLLYLTGPPTTPAAARAHLVPVGEAAVRELALTGVDRAPDYSLWGLADGGTGLVVELDGQVIAAGAADWEWLVHLAVAPDADATEAVLAALASGPARAAVPGPHPALRTLLAAGWRIDDFDHHMSSRDGLLDPRTVLSPSLA